METRRNFIYQSGTVLLLVTAASAAGLDQIGRASCRERV